MAEYRKSKRFFATKTENLPEGYLKNLAIIFKSLEKDYAKCLKIFEKIKVIIKECSLIQNKIDSEKNEVKKAKLDAKLNKLKDKLTEQLTKYWVYNVKNSHYWVQPVLVHIFSYIGTENQKKVQAAIEDAKKQILETAKKVEDATK